MDDDNPKFPCSSLRLFFSVDIVGSTAFKQSHKKASDQPGQPWLEPFSAFFSGLDEQLNYQWSASQSNLGEEMIAEIGEPPRFWKAAGDEVLYVQEITSLLQPLFTLSTLREAINKYRNELKRVSMSLDLKAAAWLAGFPINNAEVVLGFNRDDLKKDKPVMDEWVFRHLLRRFLYEKSKRPGEVLDYIGPQMDLGFRLAAKATPRRMMLSVDLALMLVQGFQRRKDGWTGRFDIHDRIFFDGTEALKGVLSGTPYPLMWLDLQPDLPLNRAEDGVRGVHAPGLDLIAAYCEAFISHNTESNRWIIKPFIVKAAAVIHGEEPGYHRDELSSLRKRWERSYASYMDAEDVSEQGCDPVEINLDALLTKPNETSEDKTNL